jgi:hypothetical protein
MFERSAKALAAERGMVYLSLDEPSVLASAKSDPSGFIESLGPTPIVIDEFQYVPELVSVVKLVSDRLKAGQRGRFLLTGSADLFSSAKIQESLPGHMARLELYPLSLVERSARSFNLIDGLIDESSFHHQQDSARQASRIKPSSKPDLMRKSSTTYPLPMISPRTIKWSNPISRPWSGEVKASSNVSERDFAGLASFAEFTRPRFNRGVLFYAGERVLPFRIANRQFHAVPLSWLS